MTTRRAHVQRGTAADAAVARLELGKAKVTDRLREEGREAMHRAQTFTDQGDLREARFWADYTVALMNLLDDQWALTVIAIHEMGLDK